MRTTFTIVGPNYFPIMAMFKEDADYTELGITWTFEDSKRCHQAIKDSYEAELDADEAAAFRPIDAWIIMSTKAELIEQVKMDYILNDWPMSAFEEIFGAYNDYQI